MPKTVCCVNGCESKRKDVTLHKFPVTRKKSLMVWLKCLGSDYFRSLSSNKLSNLFICEKHFEKRFKIQKTQHSKHLPASAKTVGHDQFEKRFVRPNLRLKYGAYPSLFTPDEISSGLTRLPIEDIQKLCEQPTINIHSDHTYCDYEGPISKITWSTDCDDDTELNSDDDVCNAEASAKTKKSAGEVVGLHDDSHEGLTCGACKGPIIGFRYTCVECAEFDMCAACERRGAHAYHYVLRVPGPRPRLLVRAVMERIRREVLKVLGKDDEDLSDVGSDDESTIPKSEVKLEPDAGPDPLQPHSTLDIKVETDSGDEAGAVLMSASATGPQQQQVSRWPECELNQSIALVPDFEIKAEIPPYEETECSARTPEPRDAPDSEAEATGPAEASAGVQAAPHGGPSARAAGPRVPTSAKKKLPDTPTGTRRTPAKKKRRR